MYLNRDSYLGPRCPAAQSCGNMDCLLIVNLDLDRFRHVCKCHEPTVLFTVEKKRSTATDVAGIHFVSMNLDFVPPHETILRKHHVQKVDMLGSSHRSFVLKRGISVDNSYECDHSLQKCSAIHRLVANSRANDWVIDVDEGEVLQSVELRPSVGISGVLVDKHAAKRLAILFDALFGNGFVAIVEALQRRLKNSAFFMLGVRLVVWYEGVQLRGNDQPFAVAGRECRILREDYAHGLRSLLRARIARRHFKFNDQVALVSGTSEPRCGDKGLVFQSACDKWFAEQKLHDSKASAAGSFKTSLSAARWQWINKHVLLAVRGLYKSNRIPIDRF
ncbi:hypothetical protein PC114_g17977 [Phytophthora cactorum]|nr:hypothetical protein PC114_g17977 [Phytophthora cactorum]